MDDDDFVLNIAAATNSSARSHNHQTKKPLAKTQAPRPRPSVPETADRPRPTKRARLSQTNQSPSVSEGNSRPKTIISSLFTSNPIVETSENPRRPKSQSAPSNAPIQSGPSFEDSGLNPLLTAHLRRKMGIQEPTVIQRESLRLLLPESEGCDRDAFIQSQTGSGKTLSFLLPILHDLLPLGELSYANRSVGTLAIIISPTRELARQTALVLEHLLTLRLRAGDAAEEDEENSPRQTRWLVSGLLTGGTTRTHEKARIRKGLPIVVATPGRLLDHIQHTASFDTSKCRWLVLDEADSLMDLGFLDTIRSILRGLEGRRNLAIQAIDKGLENATTDWDWHRPRRNVLCSATLREDVKSLAGDVLNDPILIQANISNAREIPAAHAERLSMPSQLTHKYMVVPLKLRLVTLIALIRALLASSKAAGVQPRIMVFCSCIDVVEFLFNILSKTTLSASQDRVDAPDANVSGHNAGCTSEIFPNALVYGLHGSMADSKRQLTFKQFVAGPKAAVLFCTSVASRGLDMPMLSTVVQYDLPTENGLEEYIHRAGRTARMGQKGEVWSFVAPEEKDWVGWLEARLVSLTAPAGSLSNPKTLWSSPYDEVLQSGFGGDHHRRATQLQLAFERAVVADSQMSTLATRAFKSHIRAYATHPHEEKHIFHVRKLHLGHLAKSFALRESPKELATARA